jgi:XRE family transcriptional regulator, fatty acid utilization regulator
MSQLIGVRIKALREERGLSQEELARQLGFNDRQTLSAIETGERRVSADELILAVQKLGVSLDYFTDPFMLVGEGRFSWRQTNVGPQRLSAYERSAGRWIAAFRAIAPKVGCEIPFLRRSLGLTRHHRYEDAANAGERFATEFDLGQVPANSLSSVLEREFGVLVLMVDAFDGISGAACRLPELDAVLINRHEIAGRRHFDLAHELFHILTWDAMPPEHAEDAAETSKNRVEQLANSFASAVLMPATALERFGDWMGASGNNLVAKLNATADELRVTASALKWRLVHLGLLSATAAREIRDAALRNNGHESGEADPPPLFSKAFVEVISRGLRQGQLSMRRSAALLDVPVDELSGLFRIHGVETPDEL